MIKNIILTFFALFTVLPANAQNISDKYNWDENPACTVPDEKDSAETAIGLYQFERDEFFYNEQGNLMLYNVYHKKVKIIEDEQINSFNKIYISMSGVEDITEVKARSVNPDGSIVDFDKGNIKEIQDDEGSVGYKIFAIEGIQKGADVEFFYVRKMYPNFLGRSYLQNKYPVKKARYELICPENYDFEFKVYNNDSTVAKKTENEKNFYSIEINNVEGLDVPRYYAYYNPLRIRVEYRLNKDTDEGMAPKYTWDEAARRVYNMTYKLSEKELKSIAKFIKKELPPVTGTEKEKILTIEGYVKRNFVLQEYGSADFTDMGFVVAKKITNERGMTKLLANLFKKFDIKHELVLTADRSNIKFDPDFQSWNYLESYLIYFNGPGLFLAPATPAYRLGLVPDLLTAVHGLFIEPVNVMSYESAIGKVKYIPPLSYERNFNNMLIDIDIDEENEKAVVKIEMSLNGLSGGYLDEIYAYVEENKREEFLKGMMENAVGANNLLKIEHREKSLFSVNDTLEGPRFTMYAEYESASLLEKAGNKYILNIGETIGEQVEMYQEEERLTDVENNNNRWYYRRITVNVPGGYQIKNPDAVIMDIVHAREGKKVYGFESAYNIDGNTYTVIINEYYKEIYTDKSMINEFKKVVNAAADFNKVSLILEKK